MAVTVETLEKLERKITLTLPVDVIHPQLKEAQTVAMVEFGATPVDVPPDPAVLSVMLTEPVAALSATMPAPLALPPAFRMTRPESTSGEPAAPK